jgi:type I phosphodiesterase/nucleotide pyrophosphatase
MIAQAAVLFPFLAALAAGRPAAIPPRAIPSLVVVITVDQCRADYLERWRPQLTGGLAWLLDHGAVFTDAYQDHAMTETAPGHATVLSGRNPHSTGIVRNSEGVEDSTAALLGVAGPGASPRRFRGTALFDWLRARYPRARALSVSRKDRGAILPIGRARQSVYWNAGGRFTTSRYYADSLPAWLLAFDATLAPAYAPGRAWTLLLPDSDYAEPDSQPWEHGGRDYVFPHRLPDDTARDADAIAATPAMDSLTLALALDGLAHLGLGRGPQPDLLAISLSATDYIGHAYGPESREIHDQILRLDRSLGWFLDALARREGPGRVVVALTADHGVTPYPAWSRAHGDTAARAVSFDSLIRATRATLAARAGPGRWIRFFEAGMLAMDRAGLEARGVDVDSVVAGLANAMRGAPGVLRVDTPRSLAAADTAHDAFARRWLNAMPPDLGVELAVTLEPGDVWGREPMTDAEHGQPSDADAHVPLIVAGPGVRAGRYAARVQVADLAPTLARLLGVRPLQRVDGTVLREAVAP